MLTGLTHVLAMLAGAGLLAAWLHVAGRTRLPRPAVAPADVDDTGADAPGGASAKPPAPIANPSREPALERRFHDRFERNPALLQTIDASGTLLTVSDGWLARFGYERHEVLGRPIFEFLAPEYRQAARDINIPRLFQLGRVSGISYELLTRSGRRVDVRLNCVLLPRDGNHPAEALTVIEDVILQRRTETALNEARRRVEFLVEDLHVTTWEFDVASRQFTIDGHWSGISDAVGHPIRLSAEALCALLHPDDLDHVRQMLKDCIEGRSARYECEYRRRHHDGGWVWIHALGHPVTAAGADTPTTIFGLAHDISQQRRQDDELRQTANLLDWTGRLAGVGGWDYDPLTDCMRWSREVCRLHGVAADYQPTLSDSLSFYPDTARQTLATALQSACQEGASWDLELPLKSRNGQMIWVRSLGSPVLEQGRVLRLFGALQNITRAVSDREALNRVNTRFAVATEGVGIAVWEHDLASMRLQADGQLPRLFGLPPAHRFRSMEEWLPLMHPEDAPRMQGELRDALERSAAGITGMRLALSTRFRARRPDGQVHHLRCEARIECGEDRLPQRLVGALWDVTREQELTMALEAQRDLLQTTLTSIGDGVITTDIEGQIRWLNPVAEQLTGWSSEEARGLPASQVFRVIDGKDRIPLPDPVASCLTQRRVVWLGGNTLLLSRNAREFAVEDSAAPIRDHGGRLHGAVLVFHDVSEKRRMHEQIEYRATHDVLTGLLNRSEFDRHLQSALIRTAAGTASSALLFLDLDQFKRVNDSLGHAVGDTLLRKVAQEIADALPRSALLARLGGDEFGALLHDCDIAQAEQVAEGICSRLEDFRLMHADQSMRIGTSIGVVSLALHWSGPVAVLQAADAACHMAKEFGRNRLHTWTESDQALRERAGQMQWASRIETALEHNQFVLFGQMLRRLRGAPDGLHVEVLLRLRTPQGELVGPSAFIPAAERFHLATRIDRWVVRAVLDWLACGDRARVIGRLSLNLSGQSVIDPAFQGFLLEQLGQLDRDVCRRLCFEVTETAAISHFPEARELLERLRAIGAHVALDDFGAGMASFGYLKRFNIDVLKIDGQFIQGIASDPLDTVAVRCFIDLARTLGIETVGEWAEQPELLARMSDMGIDFAQGFAVHQPCPLSQFLPDHPPRQSA